MSHQAASAAAPAVAISGNNRWVAYTIYPKADDAKKARKDRRTLPTRVGVIELATGTKREFERVRSFRFAGDRSNVLALQLHATRMRRGGGPVRPERKRRRWRRRRAGRW